MANATLHVRRPGSVVRAPDRIPVRPIDLAPARNLALAEGMFEPRARYRPHAHRSIEQATYVLEGEVRVTSFDPAAGEARSVSIRTGESVVTLPGESLEFTCLSATAARVLFITAPPYPADDSDTVVLDRHREVTADELGQRQR